jgi:drug/metabolite transporter (DMT)-like permease
MLCLYAVSFSFAYLSLSTGAGALILFAAVQITMIGTGFYSGERPRSLEWLGLFIAISGLIYLVSPGLSRPSPFGSALMAVAGIAWGRLFAVRPRHRRSNARHRGELLARRAVGRGGRAVMVAGALYLSHGISVGKLIRFDLIRSRLCYLVCGAARPHRHSRCHGATSGAGYRRARRSAVPGRRDHDPPRSLGSDYFK